MNTEKNDHQADNNPEDPEIEIDTIEDVERGEPISAVVPCVREGQRPRPPRRLRDTPVPASVRRVVSAEGNSNTASDEIDIEALMAPPAQLMQVPDLSTFPLAAPGKAPAPDDSGVRFNWETGNTELYPLGTGTPRK